MNEKTNLLGTCSKIIAVVSAIAFVITALISLLVFNMQRIYLNPDTYKTLFMEQNVYERLSTVLAKQIVYSLSYDPCATNPNECEHRDKEGMVENDGAPAYLKNLTVEDWKIILSNILTPEWAKSQTEMLLDQFFSFINSEKEELELSISFLELKTNLMGPKGKELLRILIAAQPPCTESQLSQLLETDIEESSPDQLFLCRPPDKFMERLIPVMETALENAVDDIPDQIDLGATDGGINENAPNSTRNQGLDIQLPAILTIIRLSPFLPLPFLALLTIFGVRSWKEFFLWCGIPFILVGISAIGMGFLLLPNFEGWLTTIVINRVPRAIEPNFLQFCIDLFKRLVQSFVRVILIQATCIAFLGVTMTGAGLFTIFKSQKEPASI